MARVEQIPASDTPAPPAWKALFLGDVTQSLGGKLVLLLAVIILVPIILYSEFRQADEEKRTLLLESVRAQGRLIAESLRPILAQKHGSPLPALGKAIKPLATPQVGVKVLYRPAGEAGLQGFYFVASEPAVSPETLKEERDKLIERGVLGRLSQSCQGEIPMALRHQTSKGKEVLFTSITPITTKSGCWAVVTTHTASEMLGTAIDRPYWRTFEVRTAAIIYIGMAVFTISLFIWIWLGLMRFRDLARGISAGQVEGPGFAAQNRVLELAEVAEEFDRMTGALRHSADSIRRAAEDNAHAFKTPIAIMRQSVEPLRRLVPKDNPRGQRALEVIEESVDRLDNLVASARRLDQATAELLDAPREKIGLSKLLDRMLDAYADSFSARGVTLISDVVPDVVVLADTDLLETVIENVVDNAVEVAPEGSEIEINLKSSEGFAELTVSDRGPGVLPENLERIFDRYVSLREAPGAGSPSNDMGAAAGGGAHQGIGLWIVRRNLQALGGEVRAENRPEGGLTITMRLPLAKVRPRRRAGSRAGTAKARAKRG